MLTASSLDAAALCLGSTAHSDIDEPGPYAGAGTAAHRFIELARVDRARALREAPEEDRDYFACLDVDAIPAGLASEVAVAWSSRMRILRGSVTFINPALARP